MTRAIAADAVEEEREIAAVQLRLEILRHVHDGAERTLDEHEVGAGDLGPHHACCHGSGSEGIHHRCNAVLTFVEMLGCQSRIGHQLTHPAVGMLLAHGTLAEEHQSAPRVGIGERGLENLLRLQRALVEQLAEDLVLVGVPTVGRGHADTCTVRDVVEGDLVAALGEESAGSVEQFVSVGLGLAVGGFWALSASLALRLVPKHDVPHALSIIFGGGAVAGIAAAPLGSLLGNYIGWRGVFFAAAGLAAIAFTTQFLTLPSMPANGGTRLSHLVHVLRMPHIALGMLGVVLTFGGTQAFATYLRPFLETVTGVDAKGVSAALFVLGAFNFLGTTAAAKFLKRDLHRTITLLSVFMGIDAVFLFAFGANLVVVFILLTGWGYARGILAPGWSTWLTRSIPERAESGGGLLVAFIQIAIMGGAAVGGAVTDVAGVRATVLVSSAVLLVGALHVHFGLREKHA